MAKESAKPSEALQSAAQPNVSEGELNVCQYVSWYRFKQCAIKTCKNYTEATKTKCLAIDRVRPDGAKIISDAEINLYKLRDLGISTRLVQVKRKKAVDRVKHMLALKSFVDYISKNKQPGGVFKTKQIILAESEYPLKVKRLGWKNWMWEYFLDEEVWKDFISRNKGECSEYELHQLLAMNSTKFENLLIEFNRGTNQ